VSDDLYGRFRPWLIEKEEDRCPFFTDGLVILNANILLNLYRVTSEARASKYFRRYKESQPRIDFGMPYQADRC
jgi:hypothetical protein